MLYSGFISHHRLMRAASRVAASCHSVTAGVLSRGLIGKIKKPSPANESARSFLVIVHAPMRRGIPHYTIGVDPGRCLSSRDKAPALRGWASVWGAWRVWHLGSVDCVR